MRMLQSVFSVAGLRQVVKTGEDRNFQKGNRFPSTEEAFRKRKMRYLLPQKHGANIYILIRRTVKILLD